MWKYVEFSNNDWNFEIAVFCKDELEIYQLIENSTYNVGNVFDEYDEEKFFNLLILLDNNGYCYEIIHNPSLGIHFHHLNPYYTSEFKNFENKYKKYYRKIILNIL